MPWEKVLGAGAPSCAFSQDAARAGDFGKGFAVVAEEVRNLAMRSAEAARNTAGRIEESVKNAENGVALNQGVIKNLEEIDSQVSKVSVVMGEIAVASAQQSQGGEQVNSSVLEMTRRMQENLAASDGAGQPGQSQLYAAGSRERGAVLKPQAPEGRTMNSKTSPAHSGLCG